MGKLLYEIWLDKINAFQIKYAVVVYQRQDKTSSLHYCVPLWGKSSKYSTEIPSFFCWLCMQFSVRPGISLFKHKTNKCAIYIFGELILISFQTTKCTVFRLQNRSFWNSRISSVKNLVQNPTSHNCVLNSKYVLNLIICSCSTSRWIVCCHVVTACHWKLM